VQLALNVSDIDEAVAFYSKVFGAEPAKRREGYANFAITEPPLKLVLIENADAEHRLNHLGVEVESTDDVIAAQRRFSGHGLDTSREDGVDCCYALQDKVWVSDPDGAPWEFYAVLADAEHAGEERCAARRRGLLFHRRCVVERVLLRRKALAELIGTALLVTAVVGSGIAASRLSPGDVGLQLFERGSHGRRAHRPSSSPSGLCPAPTSIRS
jgi:catechol 2,3-dioxygenase-like lactoylglutathione lyase family enzyme